MSEKDELEKESIDSEREEMNEGQHELKENYE